MDAPSDAFLWVKALHIIAVVCWFAALFYLPRLYVYHAMSEDAVSHQRFEVMDASCTVASCGQPCWLP